jgi:phosphoglycolate phosphatase
VKPAILFDLDGVLADSAGPIIACVNEALAALGLPRRTDGEIKAIIGPPMDVGMGALLGLAPEDPQVERAIAEYRARYEEGLKATPTYPGIPEVIEALAGDHLLGVATSKPRRYALPTLEAVGLAPRFAYVAGPEPGGSHTKDAMVAEALAALPTATTMIGDRRYDIEAARAHGLRAVGVTWGFGSRDELADADVLVDAPHELLDI